jgi:putative transposase
MGSATILGYNKSMPRITRTDVGEEVYHVLNRANARVQIFDNDEDYQIFESILKDAVEKFDMRLLAYCMMPNHWHLVIQPKKDGDMSKFIGWITNTHTRRWHTNKGTIGEEHLYQGRYKSFICQKDDYFLTLVRYVERNAKKANLCRLAEDWQWSSIYRREKGSAKQKEILSEWPIDIPKNYLLLANQDQNINEEEVIENSITKGNPYGNIDWVKRVVKVSKLDKKIK